MRRPPAAFVAIVLLLSTISASAQVPRLQTVLSGLTSPIYATHAPGEAERLFVVQQGGVILLLTNTSAVPSTFLNITSRVNSGGERGLLGLAFHPNYQENGFFYVNYTANPTGQQLVTRIARFQATGTPPRRPVPVRTPSSSCSNSISPLATTTRG